MALDLDGFETWRAIADHPRLFASLRADASKAVRTALSKLLRSRAVGLPALREIREALGQGIFVLVVNGMKDGEVKALVNRLDKHHPEQKTASADWRRRHIFGLAKGEAEPAVKPAPAGRARRARSSGARKRAAERPAGLSYASAGATRKR